MFSQSSIVSDFGLFLEIKEAVLELPEALIFLLFGYLEFKPLIFELIMGDQSRLNLVQ